MTDDELRERVARAIGEAVSLWLHEHPGSVLEDVDVPHLADAALAAIRPVIWNEALEEAAQVVTEHYEELCTEHRLLLLNRAAAIRALKEGNNG